MGLLPKFLNPDSADLQIADSEYRSPDYNDLNDTNINDVCFEQYFLLCKKCAQIM